MSMVKVATTARPAGVRLARHRVIEELLKLEVPLSQSEQEIAHQILAEVAANALQHGCDPDDPDQEFLIEADVVDGGDLWMAVTDSGRGRTPSRRAEEGDESGRGLSIVACLASAYGAVVHADGRRTVWFKLPVYRLYLAATEEQPSVMGRVEDVRASGVALTIAILHTHGQAGSARSQSVAGALATTGSIPAVGISAGRAA
ncbi:ATP-binding protein [Kitasatospora aureofaciens]